MKNGLKIYACTGIGSLGIGETHEQYDYWLDDTKTITNTIAVNNLLGKINLIASDLRYNEDLTDAKALIELQLIDVYAVCLQAAQTYNDSELIRFGGIIARYVEDGKFLYAEMDNEKRNQYLNDIYEELETLFLTGSNYTVNNAFYEWFVTNVAEKNYCGLSEAKQAELQNLLSGISGVGANNDKSDPASYLHDCGGYYLYTYIKPEQIKKLNYADPIAVKYRKEEEVYNYVMRAYTQLGGEDFAISCIESGIRDRYQHTPQYIVDKLTSAKGIGLATEAILAIISAVVTIVTTLLGTIFSICQVVVENKYAQPEAPETGIPEDTDWGDLEKKEQQKKYLMYGAIGLAALWLISKLK